MFWLWTFLILGVVVVLGVSYYGSLEIVRIPYLPVPYTPKDFHWPYEEVSFQSADGLRLTGWFIPAPTPSTTTVIILHGIGSNGGDMLLNTACLYAPGLWNLFYFNFRGHGGSQGHATSLGPLELQDLGSALQYLQQNKPQASRRIGIYGHSLGAAVALVGAAQFPQIAAVAVESPFASTAGTVTHFSRTFYGIPYFPFIPLALGFSSWRLGAAIARFSPLEAAPKIAPRPLFFIAAERDVRIPLSDTRAVWEAAQEPKDLWVVPGADHGDPWLIAKEEYERRLVGFFEKALS